MSPLSITLLALGIPAALVAVLLPAGRLFQRMQAWYEELPAELKEELGEAEGGRNRDRRALRDILLFAALLGALLVGDSFVPGDWVLGVVYAICGLLYAAATLHRIRLARKLGPEAPADARLYLRWSVALHGAAAVAFALFGLLSLTYQAA